MPRTPNPEKQQPYFFRYPTKLALTKRIREAAANDSNRGVASWVVMHLLAAVEKSEKCQSDTD